MGSGHAVLSILTHLQPSHCNVVVVTIQPSTLMEAPMGLMDVLNGMQNGPRGNANSSGMSPVTMAVIGLLAYKALKSFTSQPSSAPAGAGSERAACAKLPILAAALVTFSKAVWAVSLPAARLGVC